MQDPPLYAGLCEKRGGGRSLFGSTAWKARFAVVRRADRALAYYDNEMTFVVHPLEYKKTPLFLPAYSAHEEAGAIPGGFEIHLDKIDWVAPGRRSLVLRFRNTLDRTMLLAALSSCGCAIRPTVSPVSQVRTLLAQGTGDQLAELQERVATLATENARLAASQAESLAELRALRAVVASLVLGNGVSAVPGTQHASHLDCGNAGIPQGSAHAMTPPSDCGAGPVVSGPSIDCGGTAIEPGAGVSSHSMPADHDAHLASALPAASERPGTAAPPARMGTAEAAMTTSEQLQQQEAAVPQIVHIEREPERVPEEPIEVWVGQLLEDDEGDVEVTVAQLPAEGVQTAGVPGESPEDRRDPPSDVSAASLRDSAPVPDSAPPLPSVLSVGAAEGGALMDAALLNAPMCSAAPAPLLFVRTGEATIAETQHPSLTARSASPPPPSPPVPDLSSSTMSPPSSARSDAGVVHVTLPPSPPPMVQSATDEDTVVPPLRPATPLSSPPAVLPSTPIPMSAPRFIPLPETPAAMGGPALQDGREEAAGALLPLIPQVPPLTPGPPPPPPPIGP